MREIHMPPGRRPGLTLNLYTLGATTARSTPFFPRKMRFHYRYMGVGDEDNPVSVQVVSK